MYAICSSTKSESGLRPSFISTKILVKPNRIRRVGNERLFTGYKCEDTSLTENTVLTSLH